jgi:undecaprenyl-diphosphatase
MLDYIVHFVERVGHWGYFVIFLVVMVECQALLGLFMPGESLVLVSGFLAPQEVFDLDVLILVIFAAAVVGDSIGYELGRQLGRSWLEQHGYFLGESWHVVEKWIGHASAILADLLLLLLGFNVALALA